MYRDILIIVVASVTLAGLVVAGAVLLAPYITFLFYAIISKEFTGYVRLWATCEKLVKGKKGGVKYKGFSSLEAAAVWMKENGAPDASYQRYKTLEDIK